MVQLVFAVGVQFAVGLVVLFTTVAEQVAVHPFVVLVTVTVYVPPFNPVIVAVVPPLLHKYVTPVAVAVALPFGVEQFVGLRVIVGLNQPARFTHEQLERIIALRLGQISARQISI